VKVWAEFMWLTVGTGATLHALCLTVEFSLFCSYRNYRIFRPITHALSIQKGSEIVKNEHARYSLERFPTDNARIICTKKGIGIYGIMY